MSTATISSKGQIAGCYDCFTLFSVSWAAECQRPQSPLSSYSLHRQAQ